MFHKYFVRRSSALLRAVVVLGCAALLMTGDVVRAAAPSGRVDFQEIYQVLKANLAGATDDILSEAAVRGMLAELGARATLIEDGAEDSSPNQARAAVTTGVFEKNYAYVRIQRMSAGVAEAMKSQLNQLKSTNSVNGLVLDLRYAGGQDYAAALALADQFVANETVLMDWGDGVKKSSSKTNAISLPVALLVNGKTSGAAEALAGMLRYREVGLLIGTNTAGQASMSKIFPLKSGHRLRVAVAPLKVADGRDLPVAGMKPDISVAISPEDEKAYYGDAYKVLAGASRSVTVLTNVTSELAAVGTNRNSRRRMNEAELVRMSREGQSFDRETVATNPTPPLPEPTVPVVTDPVLARALDLLKGLAVVKQFRSN